MRFKEKKLFQGMNEKVPNLVLEGKKRLKSVSEKVSNVKNPYKI